MPPHQNIHRRIMKKCSGDGKTLSLSSRKVTSLLLQHRIQSILCLQNSYRFTCLSAASICSLDTDGSAISGFFYRSLEQITVMSHQGDLIHQTGLFNLLNRYIIDLDLSRKCTILPCQKCRNGTFPQPDRPTRETNFPDGMVSEISRNTFRSGS